MGLAIHFNYYGTKPSYDDILNILLPLILSNTNIQKCEDEVVSLIQKYVKYLKKEDNLFEYILGAVIYNALMHYLLENKNIEYNDLLQLLKEKIIGFSIELEKLNMIKFQMARINAIQLIDNYIDLKVEDYQDGKIIRNLLNVIYDIYIEERNVNNTGVLSIKKSILSILGEESNLNMDNIDFLEQMSHYIIKIRKYAINKKTYKLAKSIYKKSGQKPPKRFCPHIILSISSQKTFSLRGALLQLTPSLSSQT